MQANRPDQMKIDLIEQIGGHGDIVRQICSIITLLPDIDNALFRGADIIHWTNGAITARNNGGTIAGLMVFQILEHSKTLWINTGYVSPPFRRQGIYTKMFDRCVEFARERKLTCISGATSYINTDMQEIMMEMGRKPVSITYDFAVPEATE